MKELSTWKNLKSLKLGLVILCAFICGIVIAELAFRLPPQNTEAIFRPPDTGKVLLQNAALVITADSNLGKGSLGLIEKGDVLFENDQILAVGQNLTYPDATVIDVTGKIVLPGFVDTHNHLWQSLIRGCGADRALLPWLNECIFPMGDLITEESAYAGVRLSTLDIITTGVTTVLDDSHSYTPAFTRGNLRALEDSGLRFVYAYCGSEEAETIADLKQVKKERIDPNPLARLQVCSHPLIDRVDELTILAALAKELDVPFNVHLLENIEQRNDKPIKALELAGAFEHTLVVNHAVHLTDEEITQLAEKAVRVCHNPLSNMRLASGIMRLPDMHKAGIKMGLGLDGGTNDTSDMFATMKTAIGLQRALSLKPEVYPTIEEVLLMATMGGAHVLGMADMIGSLTPGKKADIIVLKTDTVNFAPHWHPLNQIVFNAQPTNVEYVFVNGKALKAKGQLLGVSEKEIIQAAEQAVQNMKAALQKPLAEPSDTDKVLVFRNRGDDVTSMSLTTLKKMLTPTNITVYEPHEKANRQYRGVSVNALFNQVYGEKWQQQEEVLFTALDGYQPSIPIDKFVKYDSYLVYEKPDTAEFRLTNRLQNNEDVALGPFYLVWDNLTHPEVKSFGASLWPYQIISLDLIKFADRFSQIVPPEGSAESVQRGFLRFREKCMTCHKINGQGGNKFKDLNYPISVTEYLDDATLKQKLDDPASILPGTTMPALSDELQNREQAIDDIIAYLKVMADHKREPIEL